jgi:hypothetical protein
MLLHRLIDAVAARLTAALPTVKVGSAMPRAVADLPAIVLSVADAESLGVGVGGQPQGLITGALQVQTSIALADPVLVFPDETVPLLSADRRTLQLPHGPLVDADGGDIGPLAPGAVELRQGNVTFALVDGEPGAGQVRVDRSTAMATFGSPLAATGTLQALYFIGQWESDSVRLLATLQADVFAAGATELDALCRLLAGTMEAHGIAGLSQLEPSAWGAMAVPTTPGAPGGNTHARSIRWRCRFEYDDPRIVTGGGPIRSIAVTLAPHPGAQPETFTLDKEAP